MKWETIKQRSPRYGELTLFNAHTAAQSWDELRDDLLELWARLPAMIREVYEPFPEDKWDRIYCDFWIDSGQVIVFPGPEDIRRASRRASISVESELVDALYHQLPDSNKDVAAFEREYDLLFQNYLTALKNSLKNSSSRHSVAQLREWNLFKIVALQLSEPDTAIEVDG